MLSTTIRALDRTPKAFKDLDTCGQKISESDCNECHNLSCIGQYACASCLISHSMEARAMALAYSSSPLEHSQRFIWIRNEKWKYEKWLFSSWIYNFSQIFKWNLFHNFFFFAFLNESESHECTSEIRWHLNTEQVTHAHFFYFFVVDYVVYIQYLVYCKLRIHSIVSYVEGVRVWYGTTIFVIRCHTSGKLIECEKCQRMTYEFMQNTNVFA